MPAATAAFINLGLQAGSTGLSIFGANNAAAAQKKAQDKNIQKQQKSNKEQWRFEWDQAKSLYDFNVTNQEINKSNTENDLQFQDNSRLENWEYGMGIRDYEFTQLNRAYDQDLAQAKNQKTFNQLALEQANREQDQFLEEALLGISFDEDQMLLDFAASSAGLGAKKEQAQKIAGLGLFKGEERAALDLAKSIGLTDVELQKLQGTVGVDVEIGRRETELGVLKEQTEALFKTTKTEEESALALSRIEAESGLQIGRGKTEAKLALAQAEKSAKYLTTRSREEALLNLIEGKSTADLAKIVGREKAELLVQRGRSEAALAVKQARAATIVNQQRSAIQELKARGAALASSQAGRSAKKVIQGIVAEAGAGRAAAAEQFELTRAETMQRQVFDEKSIAQQLMLSEQEIDQRLLFEQQAIKQKQMFDEQNISQQLLFNQANIEQKQMFDEFEISQALGFNKARIGQTKTFSLQETAQQLLFNEQFLKQRQLSSEQRSFTGLKYDTLGLQTRQGFNQQEILQQLMLNELEVVQQLMFTDQNIDIEFDKLNEQLTLDREQIFASRLSLDAKDKNIRAQFELDRRQADMDADNSIMLKPEIRPALPKPATLPRPEYQEIFKPERPPEPIKGTSYYSSPNLAIGTSIMQGLTSLQKAGVFEDLFNNNNNPFNTNNFSAANLDSSIFNLSSSQLPSWISDTDFESLGFEFSTL